MILVNLPIMPDVNESNPQTSSDHRRFPRFQIGIPIIVRKVDVNEHAHVLMRSQEKNPQRSALTKDISLTGIFFYTSGPFDLGDEIEMQITLGTRTYSFNALVMRTEVKQLPGRVMYGAGVQFVKSPTIGTNLPILAAFLQQRSKSIGLKHPV